MAFDRCRRKSDVIKGERVFTDAARAYAVGACRRMAEALRARADRVSALGEAINSAKTAKELAAAHQASYHALGTHTGDDYRHLVRGHAQFDAFYRDLRSTCSYCGKKVWGGTGLTLLGRRVFGCTADACSRKMDREIAKDRKLHPRRWARPKPKRRGERVRRSRRWAKPNPKYRGRR